jgi:hypothetical protein|tara:strand:+ start:1663 stop:1926 length:264 start_codon:yes stop_codon:yes gene_type:complete
MAKYPTKAKKTAPFSPIIGRIASAVVNRSERKRFNKEDKAYQSSLKKMGATVNGGGRANVRPAGASNPATQKGTPKSGKTLNRSVDA